MPEQDPTAGKAFVWLISCILFISVAAGGGFLIMYMTLPDSQTTSWLPIAGVALVCLPWLFWFITFLYRILSRTCGFRMVCFHGGGGDISVGGANVASTTGGLTSDLPAMNAEPPVGSPRSDARRVQFGGAAVLGDQDADGSKLDKDRKRSSSSSSSSNSIVSHESEMPLALSRAS